jgi:hypothetical protein
MENGKKWNFLPLVIYIDTTCCTSLRISHIALHFHEVIAPMHHYDIKVTCEGESVVVSTSTFLAFSDFEEWIRCRFGVNKSKRIAFQDPTGKEIIPSLRQNDGKHSHAQEIIVIVLKNPEPEKPRPSKDSWDAADFLAPSFVYPVVLLAYFISIIASSTNPLGPKNFFQYVAPTLTFLQVEPEHQYKLYADMYAAFVTWPVISPAQTLRISIIFTFIVFAGYLFLYSKGIKP